MTGQCGTGSTSRYIWNHKMQSLLVRESFFSAYMAVADDYLVWFRTIGKPYLLLPEVRSRQICPKRKYRLVQQYGMRRGRTMGLSSTLVENALPMATQYSGQFALLIPVQFGNPMFFSQPPSYYRPLPYMVDSFTLANTYFEAWMSLVYYTTM